MTTTTTALVTALDAAVPDPTTFDALLRRAVYAYLPPPLEDDDEEAEAHEEPVRGGDTGSSGADVQQQQQRQWQQQQQQQQRTPRPVRRARPPRPRVLLGCWEPRPDPAQAALVASIDAQLHATALMGECFFHSSGTNTLLADSEGWLAVASPLSLVVIALQDVLVRC
jgi:hypothetical protein